MGSRVECKCGNVINTGSFPNEDVSHLVSEESYEVLDPFDRIKAEQLFLGGVKVIKCRQCDRMIVQEGDNINYYSKQPIMVRESNITGDSLMFFVRDEDIPEGEPFDLIVTGGYEIDHTKMGKQENGKTFIG